MNDLMKKLIGDRSKLVMPAHFFPPHNPADNQFSTIIKQMEKAGTNCCNMPDIDLPMHVSCDFGTVEKTVIIKGTWSTKHGFILHNE